MMSVAALGDAVDRFTRTTTRIDIPEHAHGRCLVESKALLGYLTGHTPLLIQITGHDYPGREHWAVYIPDDPTEPGLDGTVVDVTARQFRSDAPFPLLSRLDDWLDDGCEWFTDGVDYAIWDPFDVFTETVDPALYTDVRIRDDIEPGPMTYPWQPGPATADVDRYNALADTYRADLRSLASTKGAQP